MKRLTIAQLNPTIGDFKGNLSKLEAAAKQAISEGSDLIITPELYITGYPPRDYLLLPDFIQATTQALDHIITLSKSLNIGFLVGIPLPQKDKKGLTNSAVLIDQGKLLFTQHKTLLPFYDVFDESRYFDSAETQDIVIYKDKKIGILICEDAWAEDPATQKLYAEDPVKALSEKQPDLVVNLTASPYEIGKDLFKHKMLSNQAKKYGFNTIMVNQVGGQDELVFDGNSASFNAVGDVCFVAKSFEEDIVTLEYETLQPSTPIQSTHPNQHSEPTNPLTSTWNPNDIEALPDHILQDVVSALTLGLKDYVHKCGFKKVLLGLSGGIDSALVAAIAVKALGKDNVLPILLPSPYSSQGSIDDAIQCSKNLNINYQTVQISRLFDVFKDETQNAISQGPLKDMDPNDQMTSLTEQNIQARLRGTLLMTFSNQLGVLLLTTGNKSELAVGYCTLYGDMNGAFNILADIPKTLAYRLAEFLNQSKPTIPTEIITKAPSAELKPDQKDQDTLPPYKTLDAIIDAYLIHTKTKEAIIKEGYGKDTVEWVIRALQINEYKRRQAAPGIKLTKKAFGSGRRIPIAARFSAL